MGQKGVAISVSISTTEYDFSVVPVHMKNDEGSLPDNVT